VSRLRADLDERLDALDAALDWLIEETGLARRAALQIAEYYSHKTSSSPSSTRACISNPITASYLSIVAYFRVAAGA
jgi:hypothetical protein